MNTDQIAESYSKVASYWASEEFPLSNGLSVFGIGVLKRVIELAKERTREAYRVAGLPRVEIYDTLMPLRD